MNKNYEIAVSSPVNNLQEDYIIFEINNNKYAINIKNVTEVINLPQIQIPETTPLGVAGYINYNGININVIDLYSLLGFECPNFSINNQLIIAFYENNFFAIHTENIITIMHFEKNNIKVFPYESEFSLIKEIYTNQNESVHIINPENIKKIIENNKIKGIRKDYSKLLPEDTKSSRILKLRSELNNKHSYSFSFPTDYNNLLNQYIVFKLGNQNYYLDIKYVKEFVSLKRLTITKLPYTQDFIKGLINIKGNFIVVIDLKNFLNNEKNEIKEGSKIIITQGKNFNIAFLVDEIKYIKNLKKFSKVNQNYSNEYILYEFMDENEL